MGNQHSKSEIDLGQTRTFGKLYPNKDYDEEVVAKAILERKLSPFYAGIDNPEDAESYGNPTTNDVGNSRSSLTGSIFRKSSTSVNHIDVQDFLKNPVECPICFLYYPRNINYTRCCDQPICTDCFVQIKRDLKYEPAECPFCVQPHFGIMYFPAGSQGYKQRESEGKDFRRKSISHIHPSVLASDDIRPDWQRKKQKEDRERQIAEQQIALNHARRRHMEFLTHGQTSVDGRNLTYMDAIRYMGADVEELMLMEAMRRSMMDEHPQSNQSEELTEEELRAIQEGATESNDQRLTEVPSD